MRVELSRYRIKQGKEARVDEWQRLLNDRMAEQIPILDEEQMKLAVVFRETINGEQFLYWFSVQGDIDYDIRKSRHEVDQLHLAFAEECIDHDYGRRDAQPQCILVPERVARAMEWADPPAARVHFENREIIRYKTGYTPT
jgi:hypothetical protein